MNAFLTCALRSVFDYDAHVLELVSRMKLCREYFGSWLRIHALNPKFFPELPFSILNIRSLFSVFCFGVGVLQDVNSVIKSEAEIILRGGGGRFDLRSFCQ